MTEFSVQHNHANRRLWMGAFVLIALCFSLWLSPWWPSGTESGRRHSHDFVNRTAPVVTPPPPGLRFSATPTDVEFLRTGLFAQPLVPVAATTAQENRELARALLAYDTSVEKAGTRDVVAPLTGFLSAHPNSPWQPALLVDLGVIYRQTGHFSKALETFQSAWNVSKSLDSPNGRAIGDAAVAYLSQFEAYLGRKESLQPLLGEVSSRPLRGTASELISESSRGLAHMLNSPELSFRCGPFALTRILLHQSPRPDAAALHTLEEAHSTPNGLSLTAVQAISVKAGMNYVMAFREAGAPMILPAVAHWKMGHYAAIVGKADGRYLVEDSTFGEDIRVTPDTLDDEASGYFLVPKGPLPAGWRAVDAAEGATVWGRGDTGTNKDNGATGPNSGPPAFPGDGNCPGGCTTWNVEPMTVSLELHDMPVGYAPPVGPAVRFDIYYSQRDVQQPQTFSYINFGPKWTTTWLSYVTDDTNINGTASLYQRGGGNEPFTFSGSSTTATGPFSQAILTRLVNSSSATTGFTRQLKDGSVETFGQALGTQFFMTAVTDRLGNKVSISYDSQMRIAAITDATGQVTTLSYGLASDPLKVTQVTDPFGRSATFTYNSSGELASVTDVLGITSSYTYGSGDFVSALQTPYGTTNFVFGDSTTSASLGDARQLTITDPLGRVSYVEFNQGINPSDSTTNAPTGMSTCVCYLEYRNTFIFDPVQYQAAGTGSQLDYTKANLIHWLHTPDYSSTSRVIESTKPPLEGRIWYDYPGQASSIAQGTSNTPLHVGRVLDDGTTQLQTYAYDAVGNVTQSIDPVGRTLTYSYDTNNIDVLTVKNTTGATSQLLATLTYNSQHEPLTVVGANGATATYAYNTAGQPTSFTDQLGNLSTYTYNSGGYLTTVTGPIAGSQYSFTYDGVGRIASATDPAGSTVTYTYDNADRPLSTTFPDGTSTTFAYNLLDLASTTDRLGQTTQMTYDAQRELTKVTDPLKQATALAYASDGKLSSIADPNGNMTTFTLDYEGRVVMRQYADGTSVSTAYATRTSRIASTTDALKQVTALTYNKDDTVASIAYSGAVNATAPVSFTYDPAYKRIASMTDGIGTTTYAYYPVAGTPAPGANQLQTVTSPVAGSTGGADAVTYTYDALNRVVGTSINGAQQSTVFDAIGRVTGITNPLDTFTYAYADATPRVSGVTSAHGPGLALTYFGPKGDELVQQMTFNTQSGGSLSQFGYTYNADDSVLSFTESYLNQKFAQLTGAGSGKSPANAELASVLAGAIGSQGHAAGINPTGYGFSGANAVLALAAALLACLGFMAYRGGRLWRFLWAALPTATVALLASCSHGGSQPSGGGGGGTGTTGTTPPPPPPSPSAQVATYGYDSASRLTSALLGTNVSSSSDSTTPQYAYAYDAASNITSIAANAAPQSISYTTTNSISSGTYDANGNPTALGSASYTWDAANRVLSYVSGTNESDFTYDGLSHLVRVVDKQNGSVVADKAYFWCGQSRCLEHDNTQTGSPVTKQYFGAGVLVGSTAYYYVADASGSVRQLVDASGNVQAQYDYDPYGNASKISGSADSDFGYSGYFRHAASGLLFATYRAYDSAHARWLNRDPAGEAAGVNVYQYVDGNPVTLVDPLGLCDKDDICKQLEDKIEDVRNELAKRADELQRDPLGLPPTGPMSIAGHQQQFQNKQTQLRNLLNDYDTNGCNGGTPADAWQYATMPTPSPQPGNNRSFLQLMHDLTGLSGWALITYIIISEGSRIIPPRNLVPAP